MPHTHFLEFMLADEDENFRLPIVINMSQIVSVTDTYFNNPDEYHKTIVILELKSGKMHNIEGTVKDFIRLLNELV